MTATTTSAQKTRCVARYSACRVYSATAGSVRDPENARVAELTECGSFPASDAGGCANWFASVVLTMEPKMAIPTALPTERVNMLAPVTTPRRVQPTTDCTATRSAVEQNPSPTPVTKLDKATRPRPLSSVTQVANIRQPAMTKTLPMSAVLRKSMRRYSLAAWLDASGQPTLI